MTTVVHYAGSELELFGQALRWKAYWSTLIAPHVRGRVLDVGAGLGATARLFEGAEIACWSALEPDRGLHGRIADAVAAGGLPSWVQPRLGVLADQTAKAEWDTVLYIDVLEHIEDDATELALAARQLAPGGCLVVLVPAHAWLYSAFDAAIGHYRRYSRARLEAIRPIDLETVRLSYIDSFGLLASAANRFLLRNAHPTMAQIAFWDRILVPLSRRIDPWLGGRVGKSLLGVFRRPASGAAPT